MSKQCKHYSFTEDVETVIKYVQKQVIDHSAYKAAKRLNIAIEKGIWSSDYSFSVIPIEDEETFKRQTISIGGIELPMPETVAPAPGTVYWMFGFGAPGTAKDGSLYDMGVWPKDISRIEKESLKNGAIHITEERAKAWADWWRTNVIDKMK